MSQSLDAIASRYIVLVLSVGRHDPDYVDAYYGPPQFKADAEQKALSLDVIDGEARAAWNELGGIPMAEEGSLDWLRHRFLSLQLASMVARVSMLKGARYTFDEESEALYDAIAPAHPETYFQELLRELESLLPGRGPVHERLQVFRNDFVIARERLDDVFKAAIAESRKRTQLHVDLPPGESFTLEYVNGKSWSGYNWFKGNYTSLIQINTDFPITIDRAIDLASHEGYPGHHVFNSLLEAHLVRARGWHEFSVYALFSPQSLIAEGTANYGIDMAYPDTERFDFEREVLFPLAHLDSGRAAEYARAFALTKRLGYAENEAARFYLNGGFTRAQAAKWLEVYGLMPSGRATQRTHFYDQYRSYVINYNLGQDIVKAHVEKESGNDREARWRVFVGLLSSPRIPSDLRV